MSSYISYNFGGYTVFVSNIVIGYSLVVLVGYRFLVSLLVSFLIVENAKPMWQLGMCGVGEESYPQRLNEVDCTYYLRIGLCGFGSHYQFNHPRDHAAVTILLLALKGFHYVIMCFYVRNFV